MPSQKNTTTGRALSMASMGAGIAGSYVGYLLQRVFLGEAKGKIKLKSTHTRAARRMADEMQALRGPAMKLGQMLSLQTGVLPDEILAELSALQMEARACILLWCACRLKQASAASLTRSSSISPRNRLPPRHSA